jgi:hypothetical protein
MTAPLLARMIAAAFGARPGARLQCGNQEAEAGQGIVAMRKLPVERLGDELYLSS